ncbi:MAG TPA: hypothetical protein VJ813_00670 [Vicinamibacterales bacterium]|nr:hypothetical protein [Vicinamibacterales bacterium]
MRRVVVSSILAIVLAFSAVRLSADSRPVLTGAAAGIELCPQFICGFALFAGLFEGQVNSRPASGGFAAAVLHGPLAPPLQSTPIVGGQFTITAGHRTFRGDVTGGTIVTLNETQFCVFMALEITDGGRGEIFFKGLLDHGPFPPTIVGLVTQTPDPCPVFAAVGAN